MIRIELSEAGAVVMQQAADGTVDVKAVNVEDLRRAFSEEEEDVTHDTGWLGANVRRITEIGNIRKVLVEDPGAVRRVRFHEEEFTVPTPWCLFAFKFSQQGLIEGAVVAVHRPLRGTLMLNDTVQLYKFPFSNVYADTKICWGRGNAVPRVTLAEVHGLPQYFWSLAFNSDLEAQRGAGSTHEMFRAMNGQQTFADAGLFPADRLDRWWRSR